MNNVGEDLKRESLSFLQQSWFLMPNWKWMGLGIAIVCGFLILHFSRWGLNIVRQRLSKRYSGEDFRSLFLTEQLQQPLSLVLAALFWLACLELLHLPAGAEKVLKTLVQFSIGWAVIRWVYFAVDAGGRRYEIVAKATPNPLDDQLAPLLTRTLKILVVVIGLLMILQNVGVNVVSILAGLGLGGLALALAAQDTAANLFGSITILADRPFKVGDLVQVDGVTGTVEEIGLRSTRLRAPTKTLITVPNSIMAKERIENLGERPARRIRHVIGVTYATQAQKLNEFIDHIRYVILQNPVVVREEVGVYFHEFGESSLNIMVNFYVVAANWDEEQKAQQDILFQIMQLAARNGIEFAFPSRTLYMAPETNMPQFRAAEAQPQRGV